MHYYVYYSYEPWGRGYIGHRGCNCLPEEDIKYFGSFKDKTFKPAQKIILQTFKTREEAIAAEVVLHNFYKIDVNPHFANKARQAVVGFFYNSLGNKHPNRKPHPPRKQTELTKQKLREVNLGKKHSDKTKQKLKEFVSKQNWYNNGKISVREEVCPSGFVPGRLSFSRAPSVSGRFWYTNGVVEVLKTDCPDGFYKGRLNSLKYKI
jgi:hypothetical protein